MFGMVSGMVDPHYCCAAAQRFRLIFSVSPTFFSSSLVPRRRVVCRSWKPGLSPWMVRLRGWFRGEYTASMVAPPLGYVGREARGCG